MGQNRSRRLAQQLGRGVWTISIVGLLLNSCSSDNTDFTGVISPPQPTPTLSPSPDSPSPDPGPSPVVSPQPSPSLSPPMDPEMTPGADPSPPSHVTPTLRLSLLTSGLTEPLYLTYAPGDPQRLYVLEQRTGRIRIIDRETGAINAQPFLTVPAADLVNGGFEQGLLGLVFHPQFQNNGLFYINYTAPGQGQAGQTKLVEYRLLTPDQADPSSARTILTIPQPEQNHNGGWMDFGSDGYLYWATGDGGGIGFLPSGILVFSENSQDTTDNLLGKILRIDVNGDDFPSDPDRNYRIPPDNPFVGTESDHEIWVYGLRNPWRASFDRFTGDLYIGDVGQDQREEINFKGAFDPAGGNYGWAIREGTLVLDPTSNPPDLVPPLYEFDHVDGQSVTGGYVYRGPEVGFQGRYIFGVFSSPSFGPSQILSFLPNGTGVTDVIDHTLTLNPDQGRLDLLGSFGEDDQGNIYALDLDGEIFRIEFEFPTPEPEPEPSETEL